MKKFISEASRNKINIEIEILESNINKYSEGRINGEKLLKCVDEFKHALWRLL